MVAIHDGRHTTSLLRDGSPAACAEHPYDCSVSSDAPYSGGGDECAVSFSECEGLATQRVNVRNATPVANPIAIHDCSYPTGCFVLHVSGPEGCLDLARCTATENDLYYNACSPGVLSTATFRDGWAQQRDCTTWPGYALNDSAVKQSTVVIIVGAILVALIVIVVAIVMVRARRRKARSSSPYSSRTDIYDGIIPNLGPPREAALNRPGHWHMMISYTQRSDRAQVLAHGLRTSLQAMGFTVWLDIDMEDKSEAAMKEAVEHSRVLVAVVTGQGPNDENAYLNRAFCQNELRWAAAAKTHVRPVVHVDDKKRIGEFISMAPEDLKWLGSVDFEASQEPGAA